MRFASAFTVMLMFGLGSLGCTASKSTHGLVDSDELDEARDMVTARAAPGLATAQYRGPGDTVPAAEGPGPNEDGSSETPTPVARKRVYIGEYTVLAAGQRDQAMQRFLDEATRVGGYLENRKDAHVVVRVPAAAFAAFTGFIASLGRVLSESVRTNDVTAEWVDLNIRITNAEASRDRLLKLLERATDMKDILAIEEQVRRLTTEIEQMKGQFHLLESQIAFSRVTVDFEGQAPPPVHRAERSRFNWVNQVGIEQGLRQF